MFLKGASLLPQSRDYIAGTNDILLVNMCVEVVQYHARNIGPLESVIKSQSNSQQTLFLPQHYPY